MNQEQTSFLKRLALTVLSSICLHSIFSYRVGRENNVVEAPEELPCTQDAT